MAYALNIVNVSTFYNTYNQIFLDIARTTHFNYFYKEDLYDWLVSMALNRVLELKYSGKVLNHSVHSLYKHIYSDYMYNNESLGYLIEKEIDSQLTLQNLTFFRNEIVKLLVIESAILIARGTNATL